MKRAEKFDAVVIGGGHNGLVCAAYLARAGQRVCVLERRHVLGGCATTEELWPGYKVSTAAYVISLFLPQIIRELKLKEYGLKILPRSPSSFTPLPDGRSLLMGADLSLCHREIAKFSLRDAVEYPRYNAFLERVAAVLEPVLSESAPDPLPLPDDWRRIGIGKKIRDGKKLWRLYRALGNSAPICRKPSSCSPAPPGRFSIAGSRAMPSKRRSPRTRSSARFSRSARRAVLTCCCTT